MTKIKTPLLYLVFIILFTSCEENLLTDTFKCDSTISFKSNKKYTDVLKKYSVDIPETWKTEMYFDEYRSEIFTADTTKELNNSYILEFTRQLGEFELDTAFVKHVNQSLLQSKIIPVKEGFGKFKGHPAYFNYAVGQQKGFNYYYLQLFVKTRPDESYTLSSKIYGVENLDARFCESIHYMNSIEFK